MIFQPVPKRAASLSRIVMAAVFIASLLAHSARAAAEREPGLDLVVYALDRFPENLELGQRLTFEVRIENKGPVAISVPSAIHPGGGYVLIDLVGPDGKKIGFPDEQIPEFQGGPEDVVKLRPGTFYGESTSLGPMREPGVYRLKLVLLSPRAPCIPDMVTGDLETESVSFRVE
ncbi:hypothetical protein FJ251_13610 [bacterium]|nr:hypothetical protein [bacterium]